ncbi:hypothetical protein B9T36_02115 [Acinetobacter sp. ANC 4204]|uniref:ribbon-helix-helix domain-containing protein n=1 Tax=Acinetobacter sp. ANC 4204 TaxID=1977884 RepID=UPI000A343051|nr:CopG family transcriptional regulator [Acinetobacter sp. ANC 4204]OTG61219.1 hypothetical protein B9T36_02115 [Acinetobacter sp. ANC 4204]
MNTSNSPTKLRAKKVPGGRVRCTIYLPKAEVDSLDQQAEKTDMSRSNLIVQTYFQGKTSNTK